MRDRWIAACSTSCGIVLALSLVVTPTARAQSEMPKPVDLSSQLDDLPPQDPATADESEPAPDSLSTIESFEASAHEVVEGAMGHLPDDPATAALEEAAQDGTSPELEGSGTSQTILTLYLASHPDRDLRKCDVAPKLVLNEVCSVGAECDEDVRVADFVELYNPTPHQADLSCYLIAAMEGEPFNPSGALEPGKVAAWGEKKLGFRIQKSDDEITLSRFSVSPAGELGLVRLDEVRIVEDAAHWMRIPDGGAWHHESVEEGERDWPGSFGASNSAED